jgi:MFS family permease
MPGYVHDLAHTDQGFVYSMLLAADALGALLAGLMLERYNWIPNTPKAVLSLAALWCVFLGAFALSTNYVLALVLLVGAGFLELAFSTMTQAIVQMNAPPDMRGRVIGLYNMSSLGMRAGSGLVVGLTGGLVGIHASLALACLILLVVVAFIYMKTRRNNSFT